MDRRRFLKLSSAVAGASTVGIAGCLGDSSDGHDPLAWLASPGEIDERMDDYAIFSTTPATVGKHADTLPSQTWQAYQNEWLDWQVADPSASEVSRYTRGESNTITKANIGFIIVDHSLDPDMLARNLQDMGFTSADSYEGFDLYVTGNEENARGLQDGTLLATAARNGGDSLATLKSLIDSANGNVQRYQDTDQAVGDILDTIDTTGNFRFEGYQPITNTVSKQGVFQSSTARGYSTVIEDEQIQATKLEVFEDISKLSEQELNTYVKSNNIFNNVTEVETRRDGNQLVMEWNAALADVSLNQLG